MTDKESPAPETARLKKFVKKKKYDELETAWVAAIENAAIPVEEFLPALKTLVRQNKETVAESLLWLLVEAREEHAGPEAALDAAREGAEALPDSALLRDEVVALYRKAHGDREGIETFIEVALLRRRTPLPDAMGEMESLLALCPGAYVVHTKNWDIGRIIGLDIDRREIDVEFEKVERSYGLQLLDKIQLLEADDFRGLILFDREKLEELAARDPARLVIIALETFGPRLTFRELKSYLGDVVPSWTKWWAGAKAKIARCGTIDMSPGAQPVLVLRSGSVSYEQRVREQFDDSESEEERLETVLDYLGEKDSAPAERVELLRYFTDRLAVRRDEHKEKDTAMFLACCAVIKEIGRELSVEDDGPREDSLEEFFSNSEDLPWLLSAVRSDGLTRHILDFIRQELSSAWQGVYAAIMPGASRAACDHIARELTKYGHGELLRSAAESVLTQPGECPGALGWLWRNICGGKFAEELKGIEKVSVTVHMFSLIQELARSDDEEIAKEALSQARSTVSNKNYGMFADVLKECDSTQAMKIRNVVEFNTGLSDQMHTHVLEMIIQSHPALFQEKKNPWEEDVVYTTKEGLARKQDELSQMVNVRLMEIARDIGNAAALGDLSENAEFTAALEERDRLTKRASTMQEELALAKILTPAMVKGPGVTVGSAIEVRNISTGETENFVFLGPWDVDTAKGIYSYRAPFAQAFMGGNVGDVVTVGADEQLRELEILEIESGI